MRIRSCADWLELLTGLGVPCAPINTLQEVLDHPHTAARGIVMDYQHPALGALKTIAQPIQFDDETRDVKRPPPMLGEHSRTVLQELGYGDAEIATLVASGIVHESAA